MPCTSNYSGESFCSGDVISPSPTKLECYLSECLCFLGELAGYMWEKDELIGHPRVKYKEFTTRQDLDKLTEELCSKLKKVNVGGYSLELQIWWRDHQEHDAKCNHKKIHPE